MRAAAVLGYWGIALPVEAFPPIALCAAVVSGCGILLFLGTWQAFNTLAALGMNVAVLLAALRGEP